MQCNDDDGTKDASSQEKETQENEESSLWSLLVITLVGSYLDTRVVEHSCRDDTK
jgi:hypothetical protein